MFVPVHCTAFMWTLVLSSPMRTTVVFLVLMISAGMITLLIFGNEDSESDGSAMNDTPTDSVAVSACAGSALCITDGVTKVVDGDTIYIKNYKIRLSLTNTPERNEAGFSEATSFTRSLCPVGSMMTVDQDDGQKVDQYGRMVAKVTCSGKNLNAELLENGYAYILTQYCKKSEFASEPWAKKFGC
jgi:micrococcal nuclease